MSNRSGGASFAILELLDFKNARLKVRKRPPLNDQYKKEADPNFILSNPRNKVFTDDEAVALESMIHYHLFHRLVVNETTFAFARTPYPPMGYSAIYHRLTPFDPRCYYSLFYGCAILKVECEDAHNPDWIKSINAVLPDHSPKPPSFINGDKVDGQWYPGLGVGGWVSLCQVISTEDGDITYAVLVVAGLDPKVQDELDDLLKLLWRKGLTVEEFHVATKWFRDYIKEVKRRILHVVVNHGLAGVSAPQATTLTSSVVDPDPSAHPLSKHVCQHLQNNCKVVDPEKLPSSFRLAEPIPPCPQPEDDGLPLPLDQPEDDPNLLVDTVTYQAKGIVPDIDLTFDDCIPYPHDKTHFLRLSGCCELKGKVVRISGPTHMTKIFEISPETDTEPFLCGFPALSPPSPAFAPQKGVVTTSIGPLPTNVHGNPNPAIPRNIYGDKPLETLRPVFVRYSSLELYPLGSSDD